MRLAGFLVLFVCAILAVKSDRIQKFSSSKVRTQSLDIPAAHIETGFFDTRIDHFRPTDTRVANFTFHVNYEHFQPGGPYYIYIKDINDVSTKAIENGLMVDIAEQTNAALYTFDHRFFGTNIPVTTFSLENLAYLTIEQCLGDIVEMIQEVRSHAQTPKIVLWGSGFGATLATWTRKKYPHLVDAVWSSSGIFDLEVSTYTYHDLIENQLLVAGDEFCRDRVLNSLQTIDSLVKAGNGEELKTRLNLCRAVETNSEEDVSSLFELYLGFITNYIDQNHAEGSRHFCRDMNAIPGDALRSLVRWATFVYNADETCFEHSYKMAVERNANVSLLSSSRAWHYFQCTQLGLFTITDEFAWMPDRFELSFYLQRCQDIFGDQYDPEKLVTAVNAMVLHFGSFAQRLTNVVYTNGEIDPWFLNGMLETNDLNATIINIPYHSKSADLTVTNGWDPVDLVNAKRNITKLILEWSRS